MLTLHSLAKGLGGRRVGNTVRCPGPGHSPNDDSLAVSLVNNDDGFTVFSHAGDDFRDCKDYVRERMGLEEFGSGRREVDPVEQARRELALKTINESAERKYAERLESAKTIWSASVPLQGTIAERYLVGRLAGFSVPGPVYEGNALRFVTLDRLPRYLQGVGAGAIGAMVGLMTDVSTADVTGVHLTYVKADATNLKGPEGSVRRLWGRQGVIRLWADPEVETRLAIGEGIETCLAGHLLKEGPPVWSAINAGGVSGFPIIPSVDHLMIYADHDKSEAGQKAADECKAAWEEAGRAVEIHMPRTMGMDLADLLCSLKSAGAAA